MSRDKFISDDLYSMRERFKRNQSVHLSGNTPEHPEDIQAEKDSSGLKTFASQTAPSPAVQSEPASTPELSAEQPQRPASTAVRRLPQIKNSTNDTELDKEQRDLEGRLLRDLSFIEAEEKFIKMHAAHLADFKAVIERQLDEYSISKKLDPRKFNQLRIEYFHAYGRFKAALSHWKSSDNSNPASSSPAPGTASNRFLAIAVLAGALIVSLTLIWLFGG